MLPFCVRKKNIFLIYIPIYFCKELYKQDKSETKPSGYLQVVGNKDHIFLYIFETYRIM